MCTLNIVRVQVFAKKWIDKVHNAIIDFGITNEDDTIKFTISQSWGHNWQQHNTSFSFANFHQAFVKHTNKDGYPPLFNQA